MIRKRLSHWKMICVTKKNGLKNYYRRLEYRKRAAKRLEDAWNMAIHRKIDDVVNSAIGKDNRQSDMNITEGRGNNFVVRGEPTTPRPPNPPAASICKNQDRY